MIIDKYKVPIDIGFVEFKTENEANTFCDNNSISRDLINHTSQDYPDLFQSGDNIEKIVTPEEVSPRQMRQALILSGVTTDTIENALNSLSEPTKSLAKIEWEYSIAFQRHRPIVAQVGAVLGWTSSQLDALWRLASTL